MMTSRERLRAAMERRQPDRVPVWCPLSLEHIIRNGMPEGRKPRVTEEFVEAECALTRRYGFDGAVLYLPGAGEGGDVGWFFEGMGSLPPLTDSTHVFEKADPNSWDRSSAHYGADDFYASHMARSLLGPDIHVGGWTGDGYSKALQWFPSLDEALPATQTDPARFAALVRYFDDDSVAWARAQIRHGGLESMHISSPYAGSTFISPQTYRTLVLSSVAKVAAAVKEEGGFSYLHTCGFIGDRLELLADTGIDGIECMDPPPLGNVDLKEAKRRVGGKIFLKGNVDSVNVLLQGSDEQVEQTIKECLEAGMPGGGYVLSTACSVAPGVPPQRVRRLVEMAERFGVYSS